MFFSAVQAQEFEPLFNGKDLNGWHTVDNNMWSVENGMITSGTLNEMVKHNTFLVSDETFQNFELKLSFRLVGTEGFVNSGFQVRSVSVENSNEMSGYQIDAGDGWWGKLYDESRRNRVIAEPKDMADIDKAVKRGEWNDYRILCDGRLIRSWINSVPSIEYTETNLQLPQDGHIGIQLHSGGYSVLQVKDIFIKKLPDTPNLPKWSDVDKHSMIKLLN